MNTAPKGSSSIGTSRAAAYVRMSTTQQDQSIPQQLDFIARYAAAADCAVVKIYRDEGKSGLTAERRTGLQQLIADIGGGDPGYEQVLVYDISRWGRFQDVDESAYYEFLCSRAGIRVIYCAEHFANDGSPLAHVIKSVKRMMAAEYSRVLSAKVFEAQAYLLTQGYKPGGAAGYGLQRLCVRVDGSVRRLLADGERKGHPTDRVVLVQGSNVEVSTVRHVFQLYTEQGMGYRAVARRLNADGVVHGVGGAWTEAHIRDMLKNEKYCGNLLYNRSTARLGSKRRPNDCRVWLRCEGAHPGIVTRENFIAAQCQRQLRRGLDAPGVLERLRAIYSRHGKLTQKLVDAEPGMPHTVLITKIFGSLFNAYALALGPISATDLVGLRQARVAATLVELQIKVRDCISRAGQCAAVQLSSTQFVLSGGLTLRVAVAGWQKKAGVAGWVVPARSSVSDFVVCALRRV